MAALRWSHSKLAIDRPLHRNPKQSKGWYLIRKAFKFYLDDETQLFSRSNLRRRISRQPFAWESLSMRLPDAWATLLPTTKFPGRRCSVWHRIGTQQTSKWYDSRESEPALFAIQAGQPAMMGEPSKIRGDFSAFTIFKSFWDSEMFLKWKSEQFDFVFSLCGGLIELEPIFSSQTESSLLVRVAPAPTGSRCKSSRWFSETASAKESAQKPNSIILLIASRADSTASTL